MYTIEVLQQKSLKELKEIGEQLNVLPEGDRRYSKNWIKAIAGVNPPLLQLLESSPTAAQEPVMETVKTSPGVEVDRVSEAISQVAKNSPGVEVDPAQGAISQVAKTSPGVEADPAEDELPKCVECFDDGFFKEASGVIKICHCSSEPKLSRQNAQLAIVPAAENSPGVDCVYCNSPEYEALRDESYRCYSNSK